MQYNGQRKKDKKTNDDPHNITHETKNQVSLFCYFYLVFGCFFYLCKAP